MMLDKISQNSSARIFSPADEAIHLAIPFFFLISIPVAAFSGLVHFNSLGNSWLAVATAFLGLNVIHNAFSFTILSLPEIRAWMREQSDKKGRNILYLWGIVAVALVLYFQADLMLSRNDKLQIWQENSLVWGMVKIILLVKFAIVMGHGSLQDFGLSILYNRRAQAEQKFGVEEQRKFLKLELWERKSYKMFCYLSALLFGIAYAFPQALSRNICFLITLIPASAIIGIGYCYPGRHFFKKIFQFRILLVPLTMLTPLGIVGMGFVHGMEYFLIYRKMAGKSELSNKKRLWAWTLAVSSLVAVMALFRDYGEIRLASFIYPEFTAGALAALGAISMSTTFLHYYIDSQIFHFSDPITRKNILPLLH